MASSLGSDDEHSHPVGITEDRVVELINSSLSDFQLNMAATLERSFDKGKAS